MSDRLAILLEKLTDNMELNLGGLRDQLRAELAALKAGQGEAVAPYGYLREVDGNVQLSVGPARPADRSGGCATPWAAIFAATPASADAVSVPAAMPERWEDRLSRMHQTIQAGCWPKRWVDDAKDYELGQLRALLAQSESKRVKS